VSDFVIDELNDAPERVRALLTGLPAGSRSRVEMTVAAARLRDEYLRARILGPASSIDAMHVALATVIRADAAIQSGELGDGLWTPDDRHAERGTIR